MSEKNLTDMFEPEQSQTKLEHDSLKIAQQLGAGQKVKASKLKKAVKDKK